MSPNNFDSEKEVLKLLRQRRKLARVSKRAEKEWIEIWRLVDEFREKAREEGHLCFPDEEVNEALSSLSQQGRIDYSEDRKSVRLSKFVGLDQ